MPITLQVIKVAEFLKNENLFKIKGMFFFSLICEILEKEIL